MQAVAPALDALVAVLLVLGGSFCLIGAIGLIRFPDFYMRLHGPAKATTLGVGSVLLASMVTGWAGALVGIHQLLIALFLFVTTPVSANLMARAALDLGVPSKASLPTDAPTT